MRPPVYHLLAQLQLYPLVPRVGHLAYLDEMQRSKCMNLKKHLMMHLKGIQSKHKATIAWAQMMQCSATKKKDNWQLFTEQHNKFKRETGQRCNMIDHST